MQLNGWENKLRMSFDVEKAQRSTFLVLMDSSQDWKTIQTSHKSDI